MLRKLTCLHLLLLVCVSLFSQVKTLQAIKTTAPPKIDGVLDDAAWNEVQVATDFIQNFPHFGQAASQKTEVKTIYDNEAIYIGAHLFDDPALIRRQITARDDEQSKDLDCFSVFLDTYHDQQNGFQFLVTSSNVQTDARLSPSVDTETGDYGDKTWDAVWDSKVSITSDGWIIEIKIPYISLRFAKKTVQDWGIQFLRCVRRNNENTFWNSVDPNVNGFVNQFGLLRDLQDIQPALRLSFSPYVSTGVRTTPVKDEYNTEWLHSGGMDVKYGINESFTLDATIVPDFGQVISDNVVNNLTPYEVQFEEYRPFFTEGIDIFNKSGLFYSRRVGAKPSGYDAVMDMANADPNIDIVKNPGRTQLYNAIKFSGRTRKKLGIGFFNAIAAPMHATIRYKASGEKEKIQTEPLANYNIVVLDQALKGRSYITFTNTNVMREGAHRDANVTGIDFSLYDNNNMFNAKGFGHYSKIFTDDPYDGFQTSLRLGKVSGKVRYSLQNTISSEKYDPNDLGYLSTPNLHTNTATISYNQFTPTRNFLSYNYELTALYHQLYKPAEFVDLTVQGSGYWYFKNFWEVSLIAGYLPDQHDYFVLEQATIDKYARRPQYGYLQLTGNSDSRKRLLLSYDFLLADFFKNPEKEYVVAGGGLRYRFSNKLSTEITSRYEMETDYIFLYDKNPPGNPKIAFGDFKEVESIFSAIYNFTPRINLTLRLRHYWNNVPVSRTALLDDNGYPVNEKLLTDVTINKNFFNTDAFFTWDFRYGSRLVLGYKNWLGEDETVDGLLYKKYIPNLGQTFEMRHGKELTARFIYFLDYNQLRRKKTN